jgi:N-acetyl-1-D-myo-inositol-2-amino-2-deoxy-alpha-D-glucopyranoside deacetylase
VTSPRLLAIFAHPDDEAFGVAGSLARAAASGASVTLVCATRGEVGQIADARLATRENLGEVRERELRAAAQVLGITDVRFLDYRDSGMAGTSENADPRALANAAPVEVVGKLVALIRELRPDVVVTFEPGGGYGHPDHVAISRHATAAFDQAAEPNALPAAGPSHTPQRLYYTAFPRSALRAWFERARQQGLDTGPFRDVDPEQVGTPDEEITTHVDVRPWLDQKRAALARHATQIGPNDPLRQLPADERDRVLGQEHFIQVRGAITPASRADLLGGLER